MVYEMKLQSCSIYLVFLLYCWDINASCGLWLITECTVTKVALMMDLFKKLILKFE